MVASAIRGVKHSLTGIHGSRQEDFPCDAAHTGRSERNVNESPGEKQLHQVVIMRVPGLPRLAEGPREPQPIGVAGAAIMRMEGMTMAS